MKFVKELNVRICHMVSDVGRRPASYPLDLRITLRQVEKGLSLSISGHWCGMAGQIRPAIRENMGRVTSWSDGWTAEKLSKLLDIWEQWHLNDVRAGTPEQRKILKDVEKQRGSSLNYEQACSELQIHGMYNHNGHLYGAEWLFEQLPEDVVAFVMAL